MKSPKQFLTKGLLVESSISTIFLGGVAIINLLQNISVSILFSEIIIDFTFLLSLSKIIFLILELVLISIPDFKRKSFQILNKPISLGILGS